MLKSAFFLQFLLRFLIFMFTRLQRKLHFSVKEIHISYPNVKFPSLSVHFLLRVIAAKKYRKKRKEKKKQTKITAYSLNCKINKRLYSVLDILLRFVCNSLLFLYFFNSVISILFFSIIFLFAPAKVSYRLRVRRRNSRIGTIFVEKECIAAVCNVFVVAVVLFFYIYYYYYY